MNPDILLFIIQLSVGAIVAFLAILLMSKTRDAAWMSMVGGFLCSYAAIVFELLVKLGVLSPTSIPVLGIPLSTLLSTTVPSLFFIIAFIIMLARRQ